MSGVTSPGIAFCVSFQEAAAPNTRFDPQQPDAQLPWPATSAERLDFAFADVLQPVARRARQTVQALFIYRRDIPVRESFTVTYLTVNSDDWASRLPRFDIERNRLLGASRARGDTTGH